MRARVCVCVCVCVCVYFPVLSTNLSVVIRLVVRISTDASTVCLKDKMDLIDSVSIFHVNGTCATVRGSQRTQIGERHIHRPTSTRLHMDSLLVPPSPPPSTPFLSQ